MTVKEIEQKIEKLANELETVKGEECEVYTRICGYHRNPKNWNKGKRAELKDRVMFKEPKKG
jgi:ribonucleoside-triphosphate reductase